MGIMRKTIVRLFFFLAGIAAVFQGTSIGPVGWFLAVNESRVRPLQKIVCQFPVVAGAESAFSRTRAGTSVLLLAPLGGSRAAADLARAIRVLRARGESCTVVAAGDWATSFMSTLGVREWGTATPDAGFPGVYRVGAPGAGRDLLLRPEPAAEMPGGRISGCGYVPVVKFEVGGPGSVRRLSAFLAASAALGIRFASVRSAIAGAADP